MNIITFWDIILCSLVDIHQRFAGTCASIFRTEDKLSNEKRKESSKKQRLLYSLAGLLFDAENEIVRSPKYLRSLSGLHGVTFNKMLLFIIKYSKSSKINA
jgi:hypothetical protein